MRHPIDGRLEADGLLIATIDMPGRSMNVFSADLMDALDALMDRVDADPQVEAVVLTSGKPSFLAGADLVMVRGFTESAKTLDADAMFELCGRLGRLFVRLEASAKPYIAAVNGLALGGGLELAMACRGRVVVDQPRVQLGLPEVRWGLLPGAGGTQRLPRLVGFEPGLSMLLGGRSMNPQEAVERGLFTQAVPAATLLEAARALARRARGRPFDPCEKFPHLSQEDVPPHTPDTVHALARQHGVGDAEFQDYPAYGAIIDAVLIGARQPLDEASATEMRQFLRLMFNPVAGNMIRSLFLNRQRADRELAAPSDLRIEAVAHGAWSAGMRPWADALAASGLSLREDAAQPADTLVLHDTHGRTHTVCVCTLGIPASRSDSGTAQALLTPPGPYGRVMEIMTDSPSAALALASLAPRLGGALPYRSGDGLSVLRRLALAAGTSQDVQSILALQLFDAGAAPQPETLDVVACAANLCPACSGGPLTHLWQQRRRLLHTFDSATRAAWERRAGTLAGAFA